MTTLDPSCGSGVMLLAGAAAVPREWVSKRQILFFGVDLDPACASMARLNLRIHGMGGNIVCGDGLTVTPAEIFGPLAGPPESEIEDVEERAAAEPQLTLGI